MKVDLRWLITVPSTFQDVDFDGPLLPLFITWCYNYGIKKLPNHRLTRWYQFCDTIGYHRNTMTR